MDTVYAGNLPRPTPETQPFWDACKDGKLMLPWCKACGRPHFYPRAICPLCLSGDLEWRAASGRATLHTFVINHRAAKGYDAPYVIAVVDLEEGPRMMSNIVIDNPTPEALAIDMPLEVTFEAVTEAVTLPRFRPVAS